MYDGDCPFCSAAASALRHAEDVGVVELSTEAADRFPRLAANAAATHVPAAREGHT